MPVEIMLIECEFVFLSLQKSVLRKGTSLDGSMKVSMYGTLRVGLWWLREDGIRWLAALPEGEPLARPYARMYVCVFKVYKHIPVQSRFRFTEGSEGVLTISKR